MIISVHSRKPVYALNQWPAISLFFLLLLAGDLYSQSFSVPIKFKIIDGGFDDSQIIVQRNGTTSQTISGKERLTLELAYNADYIISFIKPGYITKRIAISTMVPANRVEQGFEPYAYGVNLFKQYEGVNTVIFNQPVAKIAFSKKIDDFDYDVDYTKSVQSAMKEAEDETQKQAEIAKKKEAEKVIAEKQKVAEELIKQKADEKKAAEELKAKQTAELAAKKEADIKAREEEKIKKQQALEEAKKVKEAAVAEGLDKKENTRVNSGEDPKPASSPVSGEDAKAKTMKATAGEDKQEEGKVKSGEDKKSRLGYVVSGSDPVPEKALKPVAGKDQPAKTVPPIDDGGVTVEEINEPNRTITKVIVRNQDGIKYTYTKVAYHWGATYYFRNGTLSITEYIYQLYTRMK